MSNSLQGRLKRLLFIVDLILVSMNWIEVNYNAIF